jgi:electron transfer flavoprotein beta subunit
MNVAVCVCQVPDTASIIRFDVAGAIDLTRVNEVLNPYDEYALEEAVRLKDRFKESTVTVFSVAPASAKEMLRKALALGADRAVLLSDTVVSDSSQTALALSLVISTFYADGLPDIVFCGKQSTDFQAGEVPPMLAELLGMAFVSGITSLITSAKSLHVEREIEGGTECIELNYPALLSVEKGLNIPRKSSIKAVLEARKKPIDFFPLTLPETPSVVITAIKPRERKKNCKFVSDENELIRCLREERALI